MKHIALLKLLTKSKKIKVSNQEAIGNRLAFLHDAEDDSAVLNLIKNRFVIVGFPDDRGVIANGGNPGAKEGPQSFRESFYKLYDTNLREFNTVDNYARVVNTNIKKSSGSGVNKINHNSSNAGDNFFSKWFVDAGDIKLDDSIEKTHENLAQVVEYFLKNGAATVFVIGGGHDFSYGSYKGHIASRKNEIVPIFNFDAHFDLRPVENGIINSGTAFSRLIENFPKNLAGGKALLEIGIQRERNPDSLYQYAFNKGVAVVEYQSLLNIWRDLKLGHQQMPLEHVRDHLDDCVDFGFKRYDGSVHLSICLDVFGQSIAPGTSASTPFGIQIQDIASSLVFFARLNCCRVIDVAELCPPRDFCGQTSRLAAALVYQLALIRKEYEHD